MNNSYTLFYQANVIIKYVQVGTQLDKVITKLLPTYID